MKKNAAAFFLGAILGALAIGILPTNPSMSKLEIESEILGRFARDSVRRGLSVTIMDGICKAIDATDSEKRNGIDYVVSCEASSDQPSQKITYSVNRRGAEVIVEGWRELK